MPKVVDLFCGAGGFTLGAHYAGFETAVAVDIDEVLTSSFPDNFPHVPILHSDLSSASASEICRAARCMREDITGIVGGPPCQGFSAIGKRTVDDPRNALVGHFFEIVREIGPAFFVMENVPGILVGRANSILMRAISRLSEYRVIDPMVLNARDYGAPTLRNRVVVIGYKPGRLCAITERTIEAARCTAMATVRDAISDLPEPDTNGWGKYRSGEPSAYASAARSQPINGLGGKLYKERLRAGLVSGVLPTVHTKAVLKRFRSLKPGSTDSVSRCPRLEWESAAPTLRAGTGPDRGSYQSIRPIHPESHRVITVREAARLQGYPDWFKFHQTKWHSFRMIGNSVSPLLSSRLLGVIANAMPRS